MQKSSAGRENRENCCPLFKFQFPGHNHQKNVNHCESGGIKVRQSEKLKKMKHRIINF